MKASDPNVAVLLENVQTMESVEIAAVFVSATKLSHGKESSATSQLVLEFQNAAGVEHAAPIINAVVLTDTEAMVVNSSLVPVALDLVLAVEHARKPVTRLALDSSEISS